jgi:hypothetical protein
MTLAELLVTLGGTASMAWVVWYFWLYHEED